MTIIPSVANSASRKISGYASSMMGRRVSILQRLLQLTHGEVLEQLVHRGVHDLGEGGGMQAQPQHGDREEPENQELARIGVGKLGNLFVARLAERYALLHT